MSTVGVGRPSPWERQTLATGQAFRQTELSFRLPTLTLQVRALAARAMQETAILRTPVRHLPTGHGWMVPQEEASSMRNSWRVWVANGWVAENSRKWKT